MVGDFGNSKQKFNDIVTLWQKRLLQLDLRNNLLNFPGRGSVVHLIEHTPKTITKLITEYERPLTFDYAEKRGRRRSRWSAPQSNESDEEATSDEEDTVYEIKGDLRGGPGNPVDVHRSLGLIWRKAKEWQDTQGLDVLFLAVGLLKWVDTKTKESAQAPLLLVPCWIDRTGINSPFQLVLKEDNVVTNTTLAVKLQEVGVVLPQENEDLDTQWPSIETIPEYLDKVTDSIKDQPDWEVLDRVYLANFSYSKLAMYHDLELLKENGTTNETVLGLGGVASPKAVQTTDDLSLSKFSGDLSGGQLDDLIDLRDQMTILPADSTQLLAIIAAKAGRNLVVHGPPGTGKSQTIANIIARFLTDNKSVLFVSEKAAAIEVVRNRLEQKGIDQFCLDLHGKTSDKKTVYSQLQRSADDERLVPKNQATFEELTNTRQKLNETVRLVHKEQDDLGQSIYAIQGRYSLLRDVPHVEFEMIQPESLNPSSYENIRDAAQRIAVRAREFREHESSHWHVLRMTAPPLQLAQTIRDLMGNISKSVTNAVNAINPTAESIGIPPARDFRGLEAQEKIMRHLQSAPGVPNAWIDDGELKRLQSISVNESKLQSEFVRLKAKLFEAFDSKYLGWEFEELYEVVNLNPEEMTNIKTMWSENWKTSLLKVEETRKSIEVIRRTFGEIVNSANQLTSFLGEELVTTIFDLRNVLTMGEIIGRIGAIPKAWADPTQSNEVKNLLEMAEQRALILTEIENEIFKEFDEEILNHIDQQTANRFRTDYQSRMRRFISPAYRADNKLLRQNRPAGGTIDFDHSVSVVNKIVDLKKRLDEWSELEPRLDLLLGTRNYGRQTNWNQISDELQEVADLEILKKKNSGRIIEVLLDVQLSSQVKDFVRVLQIVLEQFDDRARTEFSLALSERVSQKGFTIHEVESLINQANLLVERIAPVVTTTVREDQRQSVNFPMLQSLLQDGCRFQELQLNHLALAKDYERTLGAYYSGIDTDWEAITVALNWTAQFVQLISGFEASSSLLKHMNEPAASDFYKEKFDELSRVSSEFIRISESLKNQLDPEAGPWEGWHQAEFESILAWAHQLTNDSDSAEAWLQYQNAVIELDGLIGSNAVKQIRQSTDDSELVPKIIERNLLYSWLGKIYDKEPLLGNFSPSEHSDLIRRFKILDKGFQDAAETALKTSVYSRYPDLKAATAMPSIRDEASILTRELARKRGRSSVRKLMKNVPHIVQRLKPCFMVSPLAVSQYLPMSDEGTLNFDVVIFDEASQVLPEEAIPSILRANQTILAGDQKQLPPTTFFLSQTEDEEQDQTDSDDGPTNQLIGMESILDAAVGQFRAVFNERHLGVHYRSKAESLIRWSNRYFYDNKLMTFPSQHEENDPWYGVHDVYIPEGRYDRGNKRDNRIEAERIVELVFEHMRGPNAEKSLGVVAMNHVQAELINDLIEGKRKRETDIEIRFSDSMPEPFFVKNLESVQGDERDRIIVSMLYGPSTATGKVYQEFGPLNQGNGQRRLNVTVTRARERIDVVHSLSATQIIGQSEGARLLKRYLEYVSNPTAAFEGEISDTGREPDSDFEIGVIQALRSRGHKVKPQVGVSKFRVDLAILGDDGSIDLGVECDGATYHSSAAARDRDLLRQGILESLGWKIHRVWSTSWLKNPSYEIDQIEKALDRARTGRPINVDDNDLQGDTTTSYVSVPIQHNPQPDSYVSVPIQHNPQTKLREYVKTVLSNPSEALQKIKHDELSNKIVEISRDEGPVHREVVIDRIRENFGLGKLKGSPKARVEYAIKMAVHDGRIFLDNEFMYTQQAQLQGLPRCPVDSNIEHMPPGELELVALSLVNENSGVSRAHLSEAIARILGFARTGQRILTHLDELFDRLIEDNRLVESFERLYRSNNIDLGGVQSATLEDEISIQNGIEEYENANAENKEPGPEATLRLAQPIRDSVDSEKRIIGDGEDLANELRQWAFNVVDRSGVGGNIWLVGGAQLENKINQFKQAYNLENVFHFRIEGGRATNGKPAWFTKI